MSSDFWAGYLSGATGIIIGNPLDLLKVRLQAGLGSAPRTSKASLQPYFSSVPSLVRGAAAPILGYGALNASLFAVYNRSLAFLNSSPSDVAIPDSISLYKVWMAGVLGGLASWVISSPTELIKCQVQLSSQPGTSSWMVTKEVYRRKGWRGFYFAGGITCVRDSVGYGFYFWSYELCKRYVTLENEWDSQVAIKILMCGGIAGVVTWASVFPLDVIKTRLQASDKFLPQAFGIESPPKKKPLRDRGNSMGSLEIAREAYRNEGFKVFYRGLGICSIRAFIVNAGQWVVYEWCMRFLNGSRNFTTP